jgi:hypothetical protein
MPRRVLLLVGAVLLAAGAYLAYLLTAQPPEPRPVRLIDLEASCKRMLAMQRWVHSGTKAVARCIEAGGVPDCPAALATLALAAAQREVIDEASRVIEALEAEDAVVFPDIFGQVRKDMQDVQQRLTRGDVGKVTQVIQVDIIETLREMNMALRKSRQDSGSEENTPTGS